MKITQDFQRVNPRFQVSLFVPEHRGTSTYCREKFPRSNRPRKFQRLPGLISERNRAQKQQNATQNDSCQRQPSSPRGAWNLKHAERRFGLRTEYRAPAEAFGRFQARRRSIPTFEDECSPWVILFPHFKCLDKACCRFQGIQPEMRSVAHEWRTCREREERP